MSFFKRLKKVIGKSAKVLDPVGGKMLNKALNPKAKGAAPGAAPEDYQGELNTALTDYTKIAPDAQQGAIDRAKAAGTFSNSTAFKEQAAAEAGAATRQNQGAAQARINSLRAKLGQPQSPPGTV